MSLSEMTKSELIEKAKDLGLEVSSSMLKADILSMIEAALQEVVRVGVTTEPESPVASEVKVETKSPPKVVTKKNDVLGFLEESGKPMMIEEIMGAVDMSFDEVRAELDKLQKDSKVSVYRRMRKIMYKVRG